MNKFEKFLFAVGTSFGRAFGITFLSSAVGILGATNTSAAIALSIAALGASVAAGLRSIQVFILLIGGPDISFSRIFGKVWGAYADAFVRVFLATFTISVAGWLAAPNWGFWHSAFYGALQGAAVAAVRALQGAVNPDETPNKTTEVTA